MAPHTTPTTLFEQADGWAHDLERALQSGDATALSELFLPESYWRDLVALTWDTRQHWGRADVVDKLLEHTASAEPSDFEIAKDRTAPRILDDGRTADFFISFRTRTGWVSALVVAELDESARWGLRARLFATTLVELHSHPVPTPTRRGFVPDRSGETWIEYRDRVKRAAATDPDVLILGGGQSGVTLGARFEHLGVSYLVIDKASRPGDGWRGRYSSLALHTPTGANNLPYVRQPVNFPAFLSKDQWANYLDSYCRLMDINWQGQTEFLSGSFDEEERVWTIELREPDGSTRTVRPKHLVTALGYTGTEPRIPDLPGMADFTGEVLHSSRFSSGEAYEGKTVMVVGTSTSAHDIALDLSDHGATVFMCQRGPACVVPVDEAENFNRDYLNENLSVEEIDQRRNSAFVYPLLVEKSRMETRRTEREYATLFDGLRKAGMKLTIGDDETGWLMKLHRTFSGYYLDVGASQAIVDGRIGIVQLSDIDSFTADGVRLNDGTQHQLDTVVMATGYQNNRATIERLLGDEIADRVGMIGGIGENGEHRNMTRPTGQPHLWMIFGGIMDARKMSDILALQITAQLEGDAPSLVRAADGSLHTLDTAAAKVTT